MRTPADQPPAIPDIETRRAVAGEFECEQRTVVLPEPVTKPYRISQPLLRDDAIRIAKDIARRGPRAASDEDIDAMARFLVAALSDTAQDGRVIDLIVDDDDVDVIVIDVDDVAR